jgi:hypothetical protein
MAPAPRPERRCGVNAIDRIAVALENLVTLRVVLEGRQSCMMHHDYPCGHIWAEIGTLNHPRDCPQCEAVQPEPLHPDIAKGIPPLDIDEALKNRGRK